MSKFPRPKDFPELSNPEILFPAVKVLNLYNVHAGDDGSATVSIIGPSVMHWFEKEARESGWLSIRWVPDMTHRPNSGCVLSVFGGSEAKTHPLETLLPEWATVSSQLIRAAEDLRRMTGGMRRETSLLVLDLENRVGGLEERVADLELEEPGDYGPQDG